LTELTLTIEKAAAGGRMLARHQGQVVLVSGTIPGERVRARVERASKSVLYATVVDVLDASPDRRSAAPDWQCGGNVFSHIACERQRRLKGEILRDALERIGRVPLPAAPEVIGSEERGYRMRARLHARSGRVGFFREGTHDICDAGSTGQLLPVTVDWIGRAQTEIAARSLEGVAGVELSENVSGDERACHLLLERGVDGSNFTSLAVPGVITGLSCERADRTGLEILAGSPVVSDVLHISADDPSTTFRLERDVRAFFQGNRYLLETLVRRVAGLVPDGPVVDLYAGVGLFGLALAAAGRDGVTLVEGDPISGASLVANAQPFAGRVRVETCSVERYLTAGPLLPASNSRSGSARPTTFIVDPPRTGMSKGTLTGIVRHAPATLIYVSCDVATFARDTRTLLDAGYEMEELTGIDLFPNTAHVEAVARFGYR
jgi:tRNA/tmRNA/rRNA uracil-C5-methylase (TrmA/RlmC/RlmD family)